MPHSVKGVIAKSKGEPVSVEIIEIPDSIIDENLIAKNKEVTCMAKNIFFT